VLEAALRASVLYGYACLSRIALITGMTRSGDDMRDILFPALMLVSATVSRVNPHCRRLIEVGREPFPTEENHDK
jgi:hypothetical protein